MSRSGITRRDFLAKAALGAAGAAALGASIAGAQPDPKDVVNYNPKMGYRRLGKTNFWISEISLGGHWKNREGGRYWANFANEQVPDDVAKNRTEVISKCIDVGINYLDITTPAECLAYGVALKGRREKMIVGADNHILCPRDKSRRSVEAQIKNAETCIRQLQFDYLDIWRIQADMGGNHTDDEIKQWIEAFHKLHDQGKIRFLGMSSHNRDFLKHVVETFPEFSMVIFPFTAKSKEDSAKGGGGPTSIFEATKRCDVGVVTIKPYSGGSLFRAGAKFPVEDKGDAEMHELARLTLAYIISQPGITATVPGMTTVYEVENNVRASYEKAALLTEANLAKLHRAADEMWANLPPDYAWLREWEYV